MTGVASRVRGDYCALLIAAHNPAPPTACLLLRLCRVRAPGKSCGAWTQQKGHLGQSRFLPEHGGKLPTRWPAGSPEGPWPWDLPLNVVSILKLPGQLSKRGVPPPPPPSRILQGRTKPELLPGVPKAFHVGPPALEEVQLPGVPPLEDLQREMAIPF